MPLALSAAPGLLLHYRVILRTPGPVGTVCAHSLAPRAYSHLTDSSCSWRAVHQGDQRLTRTSAQGVEGKDSDVFVAELVVDHRPPGLSELRGGLGVGQAARRRTPAALRNGRWLTWIGAMKNSTPTAGSGWSTRTRHLAPIHLPSAEDAMA